VPSGYWKLVAVRGGGGVEAIGFIMDQNLARNADFCAVGNRADLLELEHRAGLRFFPPLDSAAFGAVIVTAGSISKRLGCAGLAFLEPGFDSVPDHGPHIDIVEAIKLLNTGRRGDVNFGQIVTDHVYANEN
jgi:hypothetical protein